MNTPSKEALEASSAIIRSLGITDEDRDLLAAIIDRHFAPLRQRAEHAEARVKELDAALARHAAGEPVVFSEQQITDAYVQSKISTLEAAARKEVPNG